MTIERYRQIEAERAETFANPDFQKWFAELGIGTMVPKKDTRAEDMMSLWTDKHGRLNSFKQIVARLKA